MSITSVVRPCPPPPTPEFSFRPAEVRHAQAWSPGRDPARVTALIAVAAAQVFLWRALTKGVSSAAWKRGRGRMPSGDWLCLESKDCDSMVKQFLDVKPLSLSAREVPIIPSPHPQSSSYWSVTVINGLEVSLL